MDISYSNVLEGARQYFQGLPSPASSSSQPPPLSGTDPPPQRPPPSDAPARYDNVAVAGNTSHASAPPATTPQPTTSSSNALPYWPPPTSTPVYARKEVAPVSSQSLQHSKTPAAFSTTYNGSRVNPAETNYTPQRPPGHNLPPIAALSNYHSSRSSRDALTTQKVQSQAPSQGSKSFHRVPPQPEYTLPRQNQAQYVSMASGSNTARLQYGHQGPKYQQLGVLPSSSVVPSATPYHNFPSASTNSTSMPSVMASTSSSSVAAPLSSQPHLPQPHISQPPVQPPPTPQPQQYAYHPQPERPPKPPSGQYPTQPAFFNASAPPTPTPQQNNIVNGHQKPVVNRVKRESPLDLSVKTVRQSADSTADDTEAGFSASRNYSPAPVAGAKSRPALQLPASVSYPTLAARIPAATSAMNNSSVGAPKIDFQANFSAHQHSATPTPYGQDSLLRPKAHHQPYNHPPSSASLSHVNSFKNANQSVPYDQKQPAYNHIPAQTPSPYDPKQAPYNHKVQLPLQPASYDNKFPPFNAYPPNQKQALPVSVTPKPPMYDHKQMQPNSYNYKQVISYEHKQMQSGSYDYKKVQQSNFDHKQPLPYDSSKQSQPVKYDNKPAALPMFDFKHSQPEVYDHSKSQSKTFDHNKPSQPPNHDYKPPPHDPKQVQYYPPTAVSQHRMPSKPSASMAQSYPGNHFPGSYDPAKSSAEFDPTKRSSEVNPVSSCYDPAKRGAEMQPASYDASKRDVAQGFVGTRADYRNTPGGAVYPNQGLHKRMMSEARHQAPPAKVPRLDTWRQTIDQQIEQRFSTYTSSRLQQPPVNGSGENTARPDVSRPRGNYNYQQYPQPQRGPNLQRMLTSKPVRTSSGAADKRVLNILRNTLEEKEARMTQLQNQLQHNAQLQQQYQQRQPQPSEAPVQSMHQHKPAVSPSLPPGRHNLPPYGAGLENVMHKVAVPRAAESVRQDQRPGGNTQAMMSDISRQPPSADLEGFAAYLAARIRTKGELKQVGPSMEQLNTMQQQHFRCPTPSSSIVSASNSSMHSRATPTVFSPPPMPTSHPAEENGEHTPSSVGSVPGALSSGGSPPKLTRERVVVPPRRRLFSRPDEEMTASEGGSVGPFLPPRDLSGLRSSSETSVFDFRDSDSEGEMPVLERQTLNEMRKDRRSHPKQSAKPTSSASLPEEPGNEDEVQEPIDPFWSATCDNFVEQLRTGVNPDGNKRRGRRKKVESAEKNTIPKIIPIPPTETEKSEEISTLESKVGSEESENKSIDGKKLKETNANKDALLIKRRGRLKSEDEDVDDEVSLAEIKARLGKCRDSASERISSESEASDDDSKDKEETVGERLRTRKHRGEEDSSIGMRLRSKDPGSPRKIKGSPIKTNRGKKKPHFGDGSDFTPGWEEQVYRFKRSLRMPPRLINIPRPRGATRLCASLPDLEYPNSPAASTMDSSDFSQGRKSVATNLFHRWDGEGAESDFDSNSNLSNAFEFEEPNSSTPLSNKTKEKIKEKGSSILNLLMQKYGQSKADRKKAPNNRLSLKDLRGSTAISRKVESKLIQTSGSSPNMPKPNPPKKGRPFKKKIFVDGEDMHDLKGSTKTRYVHKKALTNIRDLLHQNGFALNSNAKLRKRRPSRRATIREVFGVDRPASAPPTCHEEAVEVDDDAKKNASNTLGRGRNVALLRSNKAVLNSKRHLLHGGKRRNQNQNLIRALASKTLLDLGNSGATDNDMKQIKLLANSIDSKTLAVIKAEDGLKVDGKPLKKKRIKLRNVRRKFRSGFDYIRKKKKPTKRDDSDGILKEKKRFTISRPSSESVQDIQNEIRGWVINKGLGETLLHRAARLGYTDVAAYCLEKLDNPASPRDNAGYTPLHEACSRGHMDIARLLLMYGANVSDSAIGGIRPLHEAAENGFVEMMRLLLSYGADPLLATYSGQTPLLMASDDDARRLLQLHLADVQGLPAQAWNFQDTMPFSDQSESGYNVLQDPPCLSPEPIEDDDIDMELSDIALPVLYRLRGDSSNDRWVLLQDLTTLLRVKSKDALLRQLGPEPRNIIKELKTADFLEQARCCQLLGSGERINIRASKVALVPYNDKVRAMLGVERVTVSSR